MRMFGNKLIETAKALNLKKLWLTFWGWIAMLAIRRIGYQGWAPIEVEGQWFLILIPKDVELPHGEDSCYLGHCDDYGMGEDNEAS